MTVGCPGSMQAKNHLVPPLILSEVLWQACNIALGQPFEFPQQLLSLVHGKKHSNQNIILTCTSKDNTLPNGLSFGSTNPLYFMMIAPSMNVASPIRSTLLIQIHGPIAHSCHSSELRHGSSLHFGLLSCFSCFV